MTPTIRGPRTSSALSRRGFLGAAGGTLGTVGLVTACSAAHEPTAGPAGSDSDQWTFTDDRGETATLDATPERVVTYVASAAALHDFGVTCAAIFGPGSPVRGEPNPQAGDLDVDRMTSLGEAWGEFNVERYAELGEALGADLGSGTVREARSRFDAASESLRRAARDNPGIRVMAVAVPDSYPDLTYFSELGVEMVRARELAEVPPWARLPAVVAGQVAPWPSEERFSYQGYVAQLERLAEAVRTAERLD